MNNIKTVNVIKQKFGNDQILNNCIDYIVSRLDSWRMLYNLNKYDINKEKYSVLEKQEESTIIICGNDVLDLTHEFVHIIYLVFLFLWIIKTNKNT